MVDEIGVECKGALEFGDGGVVLTLVKQDISKLSARLWQAGVEVHSRLRQFQGAIERGGTEIIAIERVDIGEKMSPRQHRRGARGSRGRRQGKFEQKPRDTQRSVYVPRS